jgi:hypothetical protein
VDDSLSKIFQLFTPGRGLFAVLDNAFSSDNGTRDVAANCPTGNCTFPVFNTLGMCSECADITSQITFNGTWTVSLPRNMTRQYVRYRVPGGVPMHQWVDMWPGGKTYNQTFTVTWGTWHWLQSLGWDRRWNAPLMMSMLRFPYHEDGMEVVKQSPTGMQCGLYPCIKTLNVSVFNGRQSVNVLARWTNMSQLIGFPQNKEGTTFRPPRLTNLTLDSENPPQLLDEFYMNQKAGDFISRVLQNYFNGSYSLVDQRLVAEESLFQIPSERGPYAGRGPFFLNRTSDVASLMENVADALTTYFRREAEQNATLLVRGTAHQSLTFISIQYLWLVPSAVMLLASGVLLFVTALTTAWKRAPLWKDSALPLLFHGLDEWSLPVRYQGPKETDGGMSAVARELQVELRSDVDGRVRLMTHKEMEPPVRVGRDGFVASATTRE